MCVCVCVCDGSGWLQMNKIVIYSKLFFDVAFKTALVKRKFWQIILNKAVVNGLRFSLGDTHTDVSN